MAPAHEVRPIEDSGVHIRLLDILARVCRRLDVESQEPSFGADHDLLPRDDPAGESVGQSASHVALTSHRAVVDRSVPTPIITAQHKHTDSKWQLAFLASLHFMRKRSLAL